MTGAWAGARCCQREGVRRPVAIEVKSLHTDAGRERFIALLWWVRAAPFAL